MNKTVNINLAGTFFHIDEDAFGKLQRYLEAIRNSISDPYGSDEIIKDIEARIAELFSEKLERQTQVVTIKELDEVIAVMGQPEDYAVDEEIFNDEPKKNHRSSKTKHLYRDIDNKFISGVSAGLGHYLGIDAIWVRLIWILLTIFSSGTFILIYILFWVLVPAAETTSEKLKMTGEPINISNIEKKFKEGYETVADKVKNADYDKYGRKVKSSTTSFFDTLGNILLTILKIFVKFIGIIIVFVSLITIISLLISLFTAGTFGLWGTGELVDWYHMVNTVNTPLWLISLVVFLAIGIPFFALFILGLKMLVSNLKSIGTTAKITLLVLWIASIVGLGILGLRQVSQTAYDADVIIEETLPIQKGDTLQIRMSSNNPYEYNANRGNSLDIKYNEDNERIIYATDVRLIVRSTKESMAKVHIEKNAESSSYLDAKKKAEAIEYGYAFSDNTLLLDGYLTTNYEEGYRDQEVTVIVYLPEGTILYAEDNTYSYHLNDKKYRDILHSGSEGKYLLIADQETRCLNCSEKEIETSEPWEKKVLQDHGKLPEDKTTIPTTEDTVIKPEVVDTLQIQKDSININQN